MKKIFFFLIFMMLGSSLQAQLHELGLLVGGTNIIGDIGRENYVAPNNVMFGAIYKRNFNKRITVRGSGTYGRITANDSEARNQARVLRNLNVINTIFELSTELEFNFFDFEVFENNHSHTPYVLLGFSAFRYSRLENNGRIGGFAESRVRDISYAIPFGIGYKTSFIGNTILGLEVRARYTFTDDLELTDDPSLVSLNDSSNNDWYMFTGLSLTIPFGRERCFYSNF
jgi:hypothetical protein